MITKDIALGVSGILALGIGAQWLAWYLKKPAIIFLLAIGLLLGPTFGVFDPDALLGDLLFPMISLGVAIILFEGALTLKIDEVKNHGKVVRNLCSIGALITVAIATAAAYFFMNMDINLALLFGSLVCVTGPTVIVPLLRSVRPNATISNILRWEGVIIDPIGALFVVLVYEFIISGHSPVIFAQIIILGFVLGFLAAFFLATALKRHWLPEYLHNVFTLSLVLLIFATSNAILEESGLLTVTVMGIILANIRNLNTGEILDFKESLSLIVISMLFILLSARIDFAGFQLMGLKGILVLMAVMFIARPLSVYISSLGSSLKRNEKLLISWIAPRGIVAAAVSSLFVIRLQQAGVEGAELLVPLVFTVIIGTVVLQSLTAGALAVKLGVADPNPNGVLIAGINPFSIMLGKALKESGFEVVMASYNYDRTREARMENLNTYFGYVVSEHADRHLSLVGIGNLLALQNRDEQNLLTALRYRTEFGDQNVYRMKISPKNDINDRNRPSSDWQSAWLFGDTILYKDIQTIIGKGGQVKTTNISEAYPFEQYQSENPQNIPLFAVCPQQKLHIFSSRSDFKPGKNWKVIALAPSAQEKMAEKTEKRLEEQRNKDEGEQNG